MVGMNPGIMRERIKLLTLTRTSDGAGGTTASTSASDPFAASVSPMQAVKGIENSRLRMITPYRVILRHRTGITPDMQIEWRGVPYEITEIQDTDPYRRYIQITMTRI